MITIYVRQIWCFALEEANPQTLGTLMNEKTDLGRLHLLLKVAQVTQI